MRAAGITRRDGKKTPTFRVWQMMRKRCTDPSHRMYYRYGGRGIRVCDQWRSFSAFLKDMGERPSGLVLDRINNDGNYEPSNCRWVTRQVNQRNMRSNRLITYRGETRTVVEWSEVTGLPVERIRSRLKRGWAVQDVFRPEVHIHRKEPTC